MIPTTSGANGGLGSQVAVGRPRVNVIAWTAGIGQVPSFDAVAQKGRFWIKKRSFAIRIS